MDTRTYESPGLRQSLTDVDPTRIANGRANRERLQALNTEGDRRCHPCPEAYPAKGTPRGAVMARAATASGTAAPCSPTRCAGCGGRRPDEPSGGQQAKKFRRLAR
jgi:hypothetical protein